MVRSLLPGNRSLAFEAFFGDLQILLYEKILDDFLRESPKARNLEKPHYSPMLRELLRVSKQKVLILSVCCRPISSRRSGRFGCRFGFEIFGISQRARSTKLAGKFQVENSKWKLLARQFHFPAAMPMPFKSGHFRYSECTFTARSCQFKL